MLRKKGGVENDDGERIKARMENLCAVVVWLACWFVFFLDRHVDREGEVDIDSAGLGLGGWVPLPARSSFTLAPIASHLSRSTLSSSCLSKGCVLAC